MNSLHSLQRKNLARELNIMDTNGKSICVLMFPWLAHGHISPFLELAKKLSQRNYFNVYLCSTPANFKSVKRKVAEDSSYSHIKLVELHLPTLPNLPLHYHTCNGLPPHLLPVLKEASDMARPNFSNILKTLKPDLLVNDFLPSWAAEAAKENNIPAVEFITSSATLHAHMFHGFKKPGTVFPFSEKNAKLGESSAAKQEKDKYYDIKCLELSSNIVLIKSFKEIEGKYIDYFSSLAKKKIVPVGPLTQYDPVYHEDEDSKIIQWLNKKDLNSTVFVSFGSECFLSNEDLEEIAHGLELSGVNFIWVVRFPMGENIRVDEKLPKGFFKRVGERGLVVEGWAPQAKILDHLNVGGFVSHCGWSSVMEGLTFGVPIIAMPMQHDQPFNARFVTEVGVGMEVVRDKNGKLEREKMAAVIKQVVVEKSGEVVRKNVRNMKEKIRMKGEEEIDVVVEELKKLCMKKKLDH